MQLFAISLLILECTDSCQAALILTAWGPVLISTSSGFALSVLDAFSSLFFVLGVLSQSNRLADVSNIQRRYHFFSQLSRTL